MIRGQEEKTSCNCNSGCSKITTDGNCNLIVTDNNFNCEQVEIYILRQFSTNEQFIEIKETKDDEVVFPSVQDGYYIIYKIIIPTDKDLPYFYENGKFYQNMDFIIESAEEISLQALLEMNPKVTGIKIEYYQYFSVCNLKKCYIRICKDILSQNSSICNPNLDRSLTYKRDLLWAALSVIDYMAEMEQYEEAQRLLEEITECNGLCPPNNNKSKSKCGCGR